eukprot:GHVN01001235.1.p1 GENE.GHVN01001235.1~~GHVN01001235.1.p1  ORF type:complete len:322 (+),score=71.08 GHVN01001235.1:111-1076(+)
MKPLKMPNVISRPSLTSLTSLTSLIALCSLISLISPASRFAVEAVGLRGQGQHFLEAHEATSDPAPLKEYTLLTLEQFGAALVDGDESGELMRYEIEYDDRALYFTQFKHEFLKTGTHYKVKHAPSGKFWVMETTPSDLGEYRVHLADGATGTSVDRFRLKLNEVITTAGIHPLIITAHINNETITIKNNGKGNKLVGVVNDENTFMNPHNLFYLMNLVTDVSQINDRDVFMFENMQTLTWMGASSGSGLRWSGLSGSLNAMHRGDAHFRANTLDAPENFFRLSAPDALQGVAHAQGCALCPPEDPKCKGEAIFCWGHVGV